jgi:hypothetical protein
MVREFTVSVNPSQDFYRRNRQDATEVQFFNTACLIVGPLVTSYVRHVIGTDWRLHRRETMSWPALVQSGKQMRNTGCEIRTVRGMIESFQTKILQQVPSLWLRVHCQRGVFLFRQKTETFYPEASRKATCQRLTRVHVPGSPQRHDCLPRYWNTPTMISCGLL